MRAFLLILFFTSVAQATFLSPCRFQKAGICFTKAEHDRFLGESHAANGGVILQGSNTTSGRGSSFTWGASGSAFQVGVGLTLHCLAAEASIEAAASVGYYGIYLGTSTAAVTYDTASPGTSPVYYHGTSYNIGIGSQNVVEIPLDWSVAYPLYPFMASDGGSTNIRIYCLID